MLQKSPNPKLQRAVLRSCDPILFAKVMFAVVMFDLRQSLHVSTATGIGCVGVVMWFVWLGYARFVLVVIATST